jgi:C1A family cysteine protease
MLFSIRHAQTPAKHQQDRPTCVAFAVTALHEYLRDCRRAGKAVSDIDLSEEFLFHHCKRLDGLAATFTGTTVAAAAVALRDEGQALEVLCPYRASGKSVTPLLPSAEAVADAKGRTLAGLCEVGLTFSSIEDSLRASNPVLAVLDWYSNSYLAPLGRIGLPGPTDRLLGRHAVLIVELDDESQPGECSLGFKNSWGRKWGDDGFGWLSAEYFMLYGRALWSLTN